MSYADNYRLIDFSREITAPPKRQRLPPARSDLPCPRLASDVMAPVQSQLDGRIYDSKSALRATYRAAGVIEVGNDPARLRPFKRKPIDEKAVNESVEKAAARVERGERNLFPGK
ncbi:hypothetical protein [Bradyrhizobium roseum]|uniref:hypothetical protein n=1 Tax=Bradyrhizobium roseum TaxID=3056648 RepID=UPI0026278CF3|nr:hypothetical protein [Bradyrhizobium roseus]WKA31602.1 hypothetical protein QUH67_16210 [Bradyrhizobium roseus]